MQEDKVVKIIINLLSHRKNYEENQEITKEKSLKKLIKEIRVLLYQANLLLKQQI